jgi:quercetin dioxygenase-like cupin family protein
MKRNLVRITLALGIAPLTGGCETLFPGFSLIKPDPPPPLPAVVDATQYLTASPPSDPWRVELLDHREELSVYFVRIQDKIEPHIHEYADETFYILEGNGDLLIEREWRAVKAGMLIHIPRNTPHAYINRAPGGTIGIATFTPRFLEGDRVAIPYDPEKPQ